MKRIFMNCFAPAALLGAMLLPIAAQAAPAQGRVTWSGAVDDTAVVYIHGRDVRVETVSGRSTTDISSHFFGQAPRGPLSVSLERLEGRGQIRIVERPSPSNDFTTAVRISDPQSGRSFYRFVLDWQSDQRGNDYGRVWNDRSGDPRDRGGDDRDANQNGWNGNGRGRSGSGYGY